MTVYTAIFGGVDELKEPFVITQGWNYVCYTDQDFKSSVWKIIKVPVQSCGPAKTARWFKINFHRHIDDKYSLWIDGTFYINTDLNRWWRRFHPPMTVIKHPFDNCIYTDIESCISLGKGNHGDLVRQKTDYKKSVPTNNGLISSGVLMRENTREVIELCETWWDEVEKYSERDQVAFGYAAWKLPEAFNIIEWDYTVQREFIHCPHLHKPWRDARKQQIIREYGSK